MRKMACLELESNVFSSLATSSSFAFDKVHKAVHVDVWWWWLGKWHWLWWHRPCNRKWQQRENCGAWHRGTLLQGLEFFIFPRSWQKLWTAELAELGDKLGGLQQHWWTVIQVHADGCSGQVCSGAMTLSHLTHLVTFWFHWLHWF